VWSIADGTARVLDFGSASVHGLVFSRDGRWLAAVGPAGEARAWDLETGRMQVFRGHTGAVIGVVIVGERVVTSGEDNSVRVWSLADGTLLAMARLDSAVTALAITSDDQQLAAGTISGTLYRFSASELGDTRGSSLHALLDSLTNAHLGDHSQVTSLHER
jgi:WD40 repeat protein